MFRGLVTSQSGTFGEAKAGQPGERAHWEAEVGGAGSRERGSQCLGRSLER